MRSLMVGLCAVAMLIGGCSGHFRHHNLGDDTIQEYIQPAKFLVGGFVDRVKCPTSKRKQHPEKDTFPNTLVCPGTAGPDAYLSWQVAVDEKAPGYAAQLVAGAMHGMWYIPAAATLGLTMPGTDINQSASYSQEIRSSSSVFQTNPAIHPGIAK